MDSYSLSIRYVFSVSQLHIWDLSKPSFINPDSFWYYKNFYFKIFNKIFKINHKQRIKICSLNITTPVPTMIFIIFWDFSVFCQIFHSPQLKRWAIIIDKYGIYELLNDLRILGNEKISGKCLNSIEWYPSAQSPFQGEIFVNTNRKLFRNWKFSLCAISHEN